MSNNWIPLLDVLRILCARRYSWTKHMRAKYINLRIDTRDLGCYPTINGPTPGSKIPLTLECLQRGLGEDYGGKRNTIGSRGKMDELVEMFDPLPRNREYWDDDPTYPFEDWQLEVRNNDTRQSYEEWLVSQREQAEEDACTNSDSD